MGEARLATTDVVARAHRNSRSASGVPADASGIRPRLATRPSVPAVRGGSLERGLSVVIRLSPRGAMVPCSRWNGADYVPSSVPSLASESECPVVTARGERSRSRRHDLGRVGQPTRFLGLGNTGKPNNSAILHAEPAGGKRFWPHLLVDTRITHFFSTFACSCHRNRPNPGSVGHPYYSCHSQLGPMYHPPQSGCTKLVVSDRGFCSGPSNGDRIPSAYKIPASATAFSRGDVINNHSRIVVHSTESLYTPDTA